jgi:Uma2 family endonuclease
MHGSRTTTTAEIEYPSSDGKPMAETDLHRDWMITNIQRLERYYAGRRVYVSGNLLIYYQEGDPTKCVAPDTFVVKNCRTGRREIFQTWKERRTPNFILETTSKTTRREDQGKKKEIYAKLRVAEYFLYDPRGDWLNPRLQGFRLQGREYEPIAPDSAGGIVSEELGVRFVLEDGDLAMFSVATAERLLSQRESAQHETQRAEQAEERAQQAENRVQEAERRAQEAERRLHEEAKARKPWKRKWPDFASLQRSQTAANGRTANNPPRTRPTLSDAAIQQRDAGRLHGPAGNAARTGGC